MLFSQIKYLKYQLLCNKKICAKSGIDTLHSIKKRLKFSETIVVDTKQKITLANNWFGKTIQNIFNLYGKPNLFKTFKHGTVQHQVVKYNCLINEIDTEIEYHFVHHNMASALFTFMIKESNELASINQYIENTFLSGQHIRVKSFDIVDENRNKIKYEKLENRLTIWFLHHNTEILQNINSALYQQNFHSSNISTTKQFQVSV